MPCILFRRQLIWKNRNITELYKFLDCQFFTSEINFDSSRFVHFLHISAFRYNKMIYSCLYWKPWQLILISDLKLMILYQTFFIIFSKNAIFAIVLHGPRVSRRPKTDWKLRLCSYQTLGHNGDDTNPGQLILNSYKKIMILTILNNDLRSQALASEHVGNEYDAIMDRFYFSECNLITFIFQWAIRFLFLCNLNIL